MTYFEKVDAAYGAVPYMTRAQASFLRSFVAENDCRDVLELGFFHGKSSAYIAAILEDRGGSGHLVTIDLEASRNREPNIESVLSTLGLSHRVTPIFARRSYTWELAKMMQAQPRPQFDLCYLDGDHTWDGTGFGFLLVDTLLRPGGWIIFDDLPWTAESFLRSGGSLPKRWRMASEDEITAPGVGMVFDILVPHLGYTDLQTVQNGWWGIARKPFDGVASAPLRKRTSLAARVRRKVGLRTRLRRLACRFAKYPDGSGPHRT